MATIQSSIKLNDGMTPILRNITRAMNVMLNAFESVQKASNKAIDVQSLQYAREQIARANASLDSVATKTRKIKPAIDSNTNSQERFNTATKKTDSSMKGLLTNVNRIRNAIGVWLGSRMVGGIVQTSDALTMASARLDLMNDGMHTTAQLQQMIYESAMRSRAGYLDMAASVSKVAMQAGSLFKSNGKQNNAAIVQFMENYNKMAAISGATAQQTSAAMLQIVQALSSGELRGDELRSVLENMPVVADYLAKKMGVARDQILELGHAGEISAEILRDAVLGATDDLNEKMKKMNYTWAQVWVLFKNAAVKAFEPILRGINAIIKNDKFQRFAEALGNGLVYAGAIAQVAFKALGSVIGWVYDLVAGTYNFIANNWTWIAPIVFGIAAALTAWYVPLALIWVWTKLCAAATKVWAGIQAILNAIMAANPIMIVILAIIALIAAIYIVIALINAWCGTTISATGIIAGAITWLGALIWNIIKLVINIFIGLGITVWNVLKAIWNGILVLANVGVGAAQWVAAAWNWCGENMGAIFENIGIWWDNLWIDAQIGFNNFIADVLSKLASLAQKIAPLAELLDIDLSGIAGAANSYSAKSASLKASKKSYKSLTSFNPDVNWKSFDYVGMTTYSDKMLGWTDLSDAYDKGYNWGESIGNKVSNFFSMDELMKSLGVDSGSIGSGTNDLAKALNGGFDGNNLKNPTLDKIANNTGDTAKNTGKMEDDEEDFSYLRQLAERQAIQRYTLTDLKIDMTNNNSIASGLDYKEMMARLAKELSRAVMTTAEGVTQW